MRIAFLTTEFVSEPDFAGGLANYLFRTCLALKKYGHTPIVFVTSGTYEAFAFRDIEVRRIRLHTPWWIKILDRLTFKRLSFPLNMLSCSISFSQAVRKAHKTVAIDIIQASSYRAAGIFLSRAIPMVVRISSFEPMWRKAYEKPLTIAQRMTEWFEAKAIIRAHAVFGPSRLIADHIQQALKIKVKVIETPFLLETLEFDLKPYQEHFAGKQYLLFFGTIGLMKGCKNIADILQSLFLQNPGLFFAFIGPMESYQNMPLSEYIFRSAGEFRNRVIMLPPLKHEALYPIVQHATAVILPSRIDNFPNTCLEAMHFGKIVVGTQGAGFEQIIDNEKSGLLCTPDNTGSLLATINKALMLTPDKRSAMSENAKKRILMLTPDIVTRQLIAFYEDVIKSFPHSEAQ